MGDISEMMLEGLLDEETGEYIGDRNKERYGMEAPGFPVSYERELRDDSKKKPPAKKKQCSICGKRVKIAGIADHMKDVHGM